MTGDIVLLEWAQAIGFLGLGFFAGVWFAAWRQIVIENEPGPPEVYDWQKEDAA